ncbi:MAG: bifunctional nuclease family protein [Phycisphaerales bacterium]|nr:bifunctional nuclease family protein [Phycisphaerales bacterium]
MDVPVELSRILIGELSDVQVIELREVDGERCLPIVVGVAEAFAIERRVKQIPVPRPMTHELLTSVILSLGARLDRVVIHDLSEGTFYAVLCLEREGEEMQIDARPSDAVALAVGGEVGIYVSEHVLEEVEREGPPSNPSLPPLDEFEEDEGTEGSAEWD